MFRWRMMSGLSFAGRQLWERPPCERAPGPAGVMATVLVLRGLCGKENAASISIAEQTRRATRRRIFPPQTLRKFEFGIPA
jgi:hypothetical protein